MNLLPPRPALSLSLVLAGWFAGGPLAFAVPANATLTLVNEQSLNEVELTIQLEPILPDATDTTDLAGTIEVLLEIDPETDQVSEITATSGSVTGSPVSLSGSRFLAGSYDFTSTTLGAGLQTPNPPGAVDPATGEFDASEHEFVINSGTLEGEVSIPLAGINETITFDFNADPIGGAGSGTGTVTLAETASASTSRTYDVTVVLPLAIEQSFDAAGLMVPILASGSIKAVGSTTIPLPPTDPYLIWAEANGLSAASFLDDANRDGVANGLQWGLGLAATDLPFPHLLRPVGDQGSTIDFTFTLPPDGSAAELLVLVSDDPENSPFTPVAGSAVSTGNPVPAGTSGPVAVSLPKNGTGFVRLAVNAPVE